MNRPPYRVVVAEDEEIARRSLRLICEKSESPVEVVAEVSTGRQVLQVLGETQPDIILMDVVMPGIDGLAAARAVHELSPATKIVIISAHENFGYAQQALRAGVVDYLLKPVRPAQLISLLKKLCADLDMVREQARSVMQPTGQETNAPIQQSPHAHILKQAQEFIAAQYRQNLTLEQVARHVGLSPTYFSRIFKQEMGYTFVDYLTHVRLEEAKRLLRTTPLTLAEISYTVGYQSPNYISELFKTMEGTTASNYRRNASHTNTDELY